MSYDDSLIKELTDEWVEVLSVPENQHGLFARLGAVLGCFPAGVDPHDPRVVRICEEIRRRLEEEER